MMKQSKRNDIIKENEIMRLSLVPRRHFGKVLDLGCGNGELSKKIKELTGAEVYGVDFYPERYNLAIEKGINVKDFDLNKGIPFEDSFFDMVFAGEIIEHVFNPDFFLREINRVLKKGGILVLTTPNLAAWHNRILLLFGIMPYGMEASSENAKIGFGFLKKVKNQEPAGHLRVFTLNALKELLDFHGFKTEEVKGGPTDYFPNPIRLLEKFFCFFPSLSSKIILRAKKS